MFSRYNQDAYAPESLDYKGFQRRIQIQAGSSARNPNFKYNVLRSYLDYDFSCVTASMIAQEFHRYIKGTRKHKKETTVFVEDVLNKILFLHNYNLKVAEVTSKYPFTTNFTQLLLHYIVLECNVLYRREFYSSRYESVVKKRIWRTLFLIYNAYIETFGSIPLKKLKKESAKAILNLLIKVKPEFDIENKLLEDMVILLLKKIGKLEKVTALKDKCIPCPLDTYLSDPTIGNAYKNIITSDYGTDDDLKIEEKQIQMLNEQEQNSNDTTDSLDAGVKLEIDDITSQSSSDNLHQQSMSKSNAVVPTIFINDDDDSHMLYWGEEVKTSDKSLRMLEQEKERTVIRRKRQNDAFSDHRPLIGDILNDIKPDVKEEINSDHHSTDDTLHLFTQSTILNDNYSNIPSILMYNTNKLDESTGNEDSDKYLEDSILIVSSDEDEAYDSITKEKEIEFLRDEDDVIVVQEDTNTQTVNALETDGTDTFRRALNIHEPKLIANVSECTNKIMTYSINRVSDANSAETEEKTCKSLATRMEDSEHENNDIQSRNDTVTQQNIIKTENMETESSDTINDTINKLALDFQVINTISDSKTETKNKVANNPTTRSTKTDILEDFRDIISKNIVIVPEANSSDINVETIIDICGNKNKGDKDQCIPQNINKLPQDNETEDFMATLDVHILHSDTKDVAPNNLPINHDLVKINDNELVICDKQKKEVSTLVSTQNENKDDHSEDTFLINSMEMDEKMNAKNESNKNQKVVDTLNTTHNFECNLTEHIETTDSVDTAVQIESKYSIKESVSTDIENIIEKSKYEIKEATFTVLDVEVVAVRDDKIKCNQEMTDKHTKKKLVNVNIDDNNIENSDLSKTSGTLDKYHIDKKCNSKSIPKDPSPTNNMSNQQSMNKTKAINRETIEESTKSLVATSSSNEEVIENINLENNNEQDREKHIENILVKYCVDVLDYSITTKNSEKNCGTFKNESTTLGKGAESIMFTNDKVSETEGIKITDTKFEKSTQKEQRTKSMTEDNANCLANTEISEKSMDIGSKTLCNETQKKIFTNETELVKNPELPDSLAISCHELISEIEIATDLKSIEVEHQHEEKNAIMINCNTETAHLDEENLIESETTVENILFISEDKEEDIYKNGTEILDKSVDSCDVQATYCTQFTAVNCNETVVVPQEQDDMYTEKNERISTKEIKNVTNDNHSGIEYLTKEIDNVHNPGKTTEGIIDVLNATITENATDKLTEKCVLETMGTEISKENGQAALVSSVSDCYDELMKTNKHLKNIKEINVTDLDNSEVNNTEIGNVCHKSIKNCLADEAVQAVNISVTDNFHFVREEQTSSTIMQKLSNFNVSKISEFLITEQLHDSNQTKLSVDLNVQQEETNERPAINEFGLQLQAKIVEKVIDDTSMQQFDSYKNNYIKHNQIIPIYQSISEKVVQCLEICEVPDNTLHILATAAAVAREECKPHDFLVNNTKNLPPTNNIYIEKPPEDCLTSEDSNDSEGNLKIDEEIGTKLKEMDGIKNEDNLGEVKNLSHKKIDIKLNETEDAIKKEYNLGVVNTLTCYDEDTLGEDITYLYKPKVKGTVLISIPDNNCHNTFDILKQIEELEPSPNSSVSDKEVCKEEFNEVYKNIFQTNAKFEKSNKTPNQVAKPILEMASVNLYTNSIAIALPTKNRISKGRTCRPFRTMAERKDYDKLKLSPYVSIERLNIHDGVKEEVKYKKTRSKSFDINIIRNLERTLNSNKKINQTTVVENKTSVNTLGVLPSLVKQKLPAPKRKCCNVKELMEDKQLSGSNSSLTETDFDDVPLSQRTKNMHGRCEPMIIVKQTKEKVCNRRLNLKKKTKEGSNNVNSHTKTKNTKTEKTRNQINTSSVSKKNKLKKKVVKFDKYAKTTGDNNEKPVILSNSDLRVKPRNFSSKISINMKKHENINYIEKDISLTKSDVDFKQNSKKCILINNKFSNSEDTNKISKVQILNEKYIREKKRKTVSKDNSNQAKSKCDTNRVTTDDKKNLANSSQKKYYRPPKLRRKLGNGNENEMEIENADAKDILLQKISEQPKLTSKIDMLSRCKNTVSPTTEKLKKKLEIEFNLSCKRLLQDDISIENQSCKISENIAEANTINITHHQTACQTESNEDGKNIKGKQFNISHTGKESNFSNIVSVLCSIPDDEVEACLKVVEKEPCKETENFEKTAVEQICVQMLKDEEAPISTINILSSRSEILSRCLINIENQGNEDIKDRIRKQEVKHLPCENDLKWENFEPPKLKKNLETACFEKESTVVLDGTLKQDLSSGHLEYNKTEITPLSDLCNENTASGITTNNCMVINEDNINNVSLFGSSLSMSDNAVIKVVDVKSNMNILKKSASETSLELFTGPKQKRHYRSKSETHTENIKIQEITRETLLAEESNGLTLFTDNIKTKVVSKIQKSNSSDLPKRIEDTSNIGNSKEQLQISEKDPKIVEEIPNEPSETTKYGPLNLDKSCEKIDGLDNANRKDAPIILKLEKKSKNVKSKSSNNKDCKKEKLLSQDYKKINKISEAKSKLRSSSSDMSVIVNEDHDEVTKRYMTCKTEKKDCRPELVTSRTDKRKRVKRINRKSYEINSKSNRRKEYSHKSDSRSHSVSSTSSRPATDPGVKREKSEIDYHKAKYKSNVTENVVRNRDTFGRDESDQNMPESKLENSEKSLKSNILVFENKDSIEHGNCKNKKSKKYRPLSGESKVNDTDLETTHLLPESDVNTNSSLSPSTDENKSSKDRKIIDNKYKKEQIRDKQGHMKNKKQKKECSFKAELQNILVENDICNLQNTDGDKLQTPESEQSIDTSGIGKSEHEESVNKINIDDQIVDTVNDINNGNNDLQNQALQDSSENKIDEINEDLLINHKLLKETLESEADQTKSEDVRCGDAKLSHELENKDRPNFEHNKEISKIYVTKELLLVQTNQQLELPIVNDVNDANVECGGNELPYKLEINEENPDFEHNIEAKTVEKEVCDINSVNKNSYNKKIYEERHIKENDTDKIIIENKKSHEFVVSVENENVPKLIKTENVSEKDMKDKNDSMTNSVIEATHLENREQLQEIEIHQKDLLQDEKKPSEAQKEISDLGSISTNIFLQNNETNQLKDMPSCDNEIERNMDLSTGNKLTHSTENVLRLQSNKICQADPSEVKLQNIQTFDKCIPGISIENENVEQLDILTANIDNKFENQQIFNSKSKKRKNDAFKNKCLMDVNVQLDLPIKKNKFEDNSSNISSCPAPKQLSPTISPRKKERKSIEAVINHLVEEQANKSHKEISKFAVNTTSIMDTVDIKLKNVEELPQEMKSVSEQNITSSLEIIPSIVDNVGTNTDKHEEPKIAVNTDVLYIKNEVSSINENIQNEEVPKNTNSQDEISNVGRNVKENPLDSVVDKFSEIEIYDYQVVPKFELEENKLILVTDYIKENVHKATSLTQTIKFDPIVSGTLPSTSRDFLNLDSSKGDTVIMNNFHDSNVADTKNSSTELKNDSLHFKTNENNVIELRPFDNSIGSSFVANSAQIETVEVNSMPSLDSCTADFSPTNADNSNILNLSDLMMNVHANPADVTNMGEITISPEDICMFSDIISTTISSVESKLFTFPVTSQANIKNQFTPLNDVSINKNLNQTSTLGSHKNKSCVFSFNEEIDSSSAETISSSELSLNLQDVPFNKIPIGSAQTLDLISSNLSVVQSSSSRGFLNQVPSATCNTIRCTEPDDHNYSGDPLLSERQEEKDIFSNTLKKNIVSMDKPLEFTSVVPLNDNQLQEFAEFSDDSYKLNLDNEYAVKTVVMLAEQTSSNVYPLSNYNVADIERMNIIECSTSNSEEDDNNKKYLDITNVEQANNSANDLNPWTQFIMNEDPNQKVVVLSNEQCFTPPLSQNDLIQFKNEIVESAIPTSNSTDEMCTPLTTSENTVNPSQVVCTTQEISVKEELKILSVNEHLQNTKYIPNKPAQVETLKMPKKFRTVLKPPPQKKTSHKSYAVQNEKIPDTSVTSNVTKVNTTINSTILENKSVSTTPIAIFGELPQIDSGCIREDFNNVSSDIKSIADLLLLEHQSKIVIPTQDPLPIMCNSKKSPVTQNNIVNTDTSKSCSLKEIIKDSPGNLESVMENVSIKNETLQENIVKPSKMHDEKLDVQFNIADLVKSRKRRVATNKYSTNYLSPNISITKESSSPTHQLAKSKSTLIDKSFPENVSGVAFPKSPIGEEDKKKISCQSFRSDTKVLKDILDKSSPNISNSSKKHSKSGESAPNKKPNEQPIIEAPKKFCNKNSSFNYSIDRILSKDSKINSNNCVYENELKGNFYTNTRGVKRSSASSEEDDRKLGRVDKKQMKQCVSDPQPANQKDPFDQLQEQGCVNERICLRVTEDNKLKVETRNSPLRKSGKDEQKNELGHSKVSAAHEKSKLNSRQEDRRPESRQRSHQLDNLPYIRNTQKIRGERHGYYSTREQSDYSRKHYSNHISPMLNIASSSRVGSSRSWNVSASYYRKSGSHLSNSVANTVPHHQNSAPYTKRNTKLSSEKQEQLVNSVIKDTDEEAYLWLDKITQQIDPTNLLASTNASAVQFPKMSGTRTDHK